EMVAGGVHEAHSKPNGQVEVGGVVKKRSGTNGHVKAAGDVVGKRARTNRHVIMTGRIIAKRIGTHSGIVDPNRSVDVEESVIALSGVTAGIAAVRWRWRQSGLRVLGER